MGALAIAAATALGPNKSAHCLNPIRIVCSFMYAWYLCTGLSIARRSIHVVSADPHQRYG
jgi:hypothetical protein